MGDRYRTFEDWEREDLIANIGFKGSRGKARDMLEQDSEGVGPSRFSLDCNVMRCVISIDQYNEIRRQETGVQIPIQTVANNTVTVQFAFSLSCIINAAIGFPTMLLRPITTQFLPGVFTPDSLSMTCIPAGVHGTNPSRSPMSIFPTFTG